MKFRFARATNDLSSIKRFYVDGLGLQQLGGFQDHQGFDGIMLGREDWSYHLEFTCKRGHIAPRSPSEDLLLVFYHPEPSEYTSRTLHMRKEGFEAVPSFNPYWDEHGMTFEDFEGYRIVLVNGPSPF